jgi:EmrB/QacA subfamily drug resistance transporter
MPTAAQETSFLATRRGKLTLALLCGIAFLDFVDGSITNVALPSIRHALHFSVDGLTWIPSGYLVTYGGFMLLGGRLSDLLGRRRVLVTGIVTIAVSSLVGGLAESAGVLVGARLAQGLGAALTLPTALSILTTKFAEGKDRNAALGAWGATGGLASAAGVLIGGALTEYLGWRWVMFVNPIACALLLVPILRLIEGERDRRRLVDFDAVGATLVTGGMLLLVYGLVRAPIAGWGSARTIGVLAAAAVVLAAFVANERRQRAPLAPLSIFRINGLGFSNVTQLVAFAGFLALFFYVTLYMQNVLGYSAVKTGLAYLPLCGIAVASAGISSQLLGRVGTRPVIVAGAVIGAAGLYWLSRIPVDGSYAGDLLPGLLLVGLGIAGLFVAVATAANAGVPSDKAGLAAALLNASQWLGGALGLAIFTAVSTSRTNHLLAAGAPASHALTSGFQRALLVGSIFILASAVIALRATNTRGENEAPPIDAEPEASLAA